jgi:hypothetical protein
MTGTEKRKNVQPMRPGAGIPLVLCLLLAFAAQGQSNEFLRFVLPTDVCANSYTTIQFGYNSNFNVVFDLPMASQSHA